MIEFNRKVLMIGFGSVAQCTLPILTRHVKTPMTSITVMDFEDKSREMKPWTDQGVHFVRDRITRENMGAKLAQYVGAGDLIIDLAWNIDCCEILTWCHEHGVLYMNTSVELWDPYENARGAHPTKMTLYWRYQKIQKMVAGWKEKGTTAVIEHGANPGLISHWTRRGIADIATKLLADKKVSGRDAEEIQDYLKRGVFNKLAQKIGVKVIHCSERDTQISSQPKQVGEFVNTWSIEGFREEGTTTAEMGWGTHEKELPPFAYEHTEGSKSQICLARMGMNTWVRSWVPDYSIYGMVVRHGEAFSIPEHLSVVENGKTVYRPTMHYAYCPCNDAIISLWELRGDNYELQPKLRIMNDEITQGEDILGALIMGHAYNSWWTGSHLSIEESRRLVPHQNATTMQVAISAVACSCWMIQNPQRGFHVPDDLPFEEILATANPYLGRAISTPSDWTPLKDYRNTFKGYNRHEVDASDPWQFKNFLVYDRD